MKKVAITVSFFALFSGFMLSRTLAADPIKIGILLPLSGSNAAIGQIQKKAVLMAAKDTNNRGGIKNRKIEPVMADTRGNPDGGRAAATKLIKQDKVLVIGGGFSSSATWAAAAMAQQNSLPLVVTGAAADKISEQGWEYVFRLNQPISEHLGALASFLTSLATEIKSVAIMHDASLRSSAAARRFFKRSADMGLELVIRERFESEALDLSEMLTRVKAKNPDLIYAVADTPRSAALIVRQSDTLKLKPKLFVGEGNGFTQNNFVKQAGKDARHIVSTALWTPLLPHPGAGAFNRKFMDKFDTSPGRYGAEAHTAVMVIADALKRSRELTPPAVRAALSRTNMMTLLGPVKFEAYKQKSRQNRLPTYLVQWINTKQEIIWPEKFATHKPVFPASQ